MKNTNFAFGKVLFWGLTLGTIASLLIVSIMSVNAQGCDDLAQNETNLSIHSTELSFEEDRLIFKGEIRCEFEPDCSVYIKTGGVEGFNSHKYELLNPNMDLIESWSFDFFYKYNTQPEFIKIYDKHGNLLYEKKNLDLEIQIFQLEKDLKNTEEKIQIFESPEKIEEELRKERGNKAIIEHKLEHYRGMLKLEKEGINADDFIPKEHGGNA